MKSLQACENRTNQSRPCKHTYKLMVLFSCRFWPVRKYPWGSCEALSSIHSDLSALKKLLFEVMYEDLKQQTESRYYKFRQNTLFNLDDPNRCCNAVSS